MSWVVFDYGEVISERTGALPELAQRLGAEVAEFESAYWAHRGDYDRGVSDEAYWTAVGDSLGVRVDAALVEDLTRRDIAGWSRLAPDAPELLATLAGEGTRLALLSNAPASFAAYTRRRPWLAHFREVLFSSEVGIAKPDAEIFDLLLTRLDTAPQDCVFFDDRPANVDAAREAGLHAQVWQGVRQARTVLP